jgi:predicted DNA-binding transcriptional regulator AlpA
MANQTALPPTLAPRLISRSAAAAYLSVSPSLFDELIKDGRMPKPRRLSKKRVAFDVRELDIAIDSLPADGPCVLDRTWEEDGAEKTAAAC